MSDWISVKEQYPKRNGRYLCLMESRYYEICSFTKNLEAVDKYDFQGYRKPGFFQYDSEFGYFKLDNITHWMPLPERPKEDLKDDQT